MNFRIEKRIGVRATPERIWDLIGELSSWKGWNPIESEVEGTIAFGGPVSLTERIPGLPEHRVAGRIGEWEPYVRLVWAEKRGWQFSVMRYYEIEKLDVASCIVANGFIFSGFRGEGFHDKHKHAIRAGCEQIADAIKQTAEVGA